MRTIAANSKQFTCMATFGNKIAAACDDGTVGIYDSVTGVLKLSLSIGDPARAIRGSPDGSILFCAHKTRSISVWDMQTGGLMHTFDLEWNAESIAVSLKGRYLAYGLPDGSVEVLDVADKMEGAVIWTGSPVTSYCWAESEELFVVSARALVRVWDIVGGTVLHSYVMPYPVHRMVYSQKFNQLAIMANSTSAPGSAITFINPQTGASTSHRIHQKFSHFAFSQTAEELVCGMETQGIWLFKVSTRSLRHFEYPDTMTSVSSLQNGTLVANFASSGIQLLSLDWRHTRSQQPTISPLTMQGLDEDRIIAIFPTNHGPIVLLELATLLQLLEIPVRKTSLNPTKHFVIGASHEHNIAVHYFEEGGRGFLELWGFGEKAPRWTVEVDGVAEIGRISPTASLLVTIHTVGRHIYVCVWNARNGRLYAQRRRFSHTHPLDVTFTSDTELWLHHGGFHTPYAVSPGGLDIRGIRISPSLPKRQYIAVDDTHEWVVSGSKRICWIPPGHIGSI